MFVFQTSRQFGIFILSMFSGNASSESVIRHYMGLHMNIITISEKDLIQLKLVRPSHTKLPVKDDIMLNGATNLIIGSYRNQLLHVFVRVAIVALSVNGWVQDTMTMGEKSLFQIVSNYYYPLATLDTGLGCKLVLISII